MERQNRRREWGQPREVLYPRNGVQECEDSGLQSNMLPCKGLEVCEAQGLDLQALELGCNLTQCQVCASGSKGKPAVKDNSSIKPSLVQLTVLILVFQTFKLYKHELQPWQKASYYLNCRSLHRCQLNEMCSAEILLEGMLMARLLHAPAQLSFYFQNNLLHL